MKETEKIFRPTTSQRERPGTIGLDDSPAPDNSNRSRFIPGPVGIQELTEVSDSSERTQRIYQLNSLLEELNKSRRQIIEREYDLQNVSMGTKVPREFLDMWTRHNVLFGQFCQVMQDYLNDYPDVSHTGELIRLIQAGKTGGQPGGGGDLIDYQAVLSTQNSKAIVANFSVLACKIAYEAYRKNPSNLNKMSLILRISDAQLAVQEAHVLLPKEVKHMIQKLTDDVTRESQTALEIDKARHQLILALIGFVKKVGKKLAGPAPPTQTQKSPPPKQKKTKTSWVNFRVVWDDTGEAVPYAKLRLTMPDGVEDFYPAGSDGWIKIKDIVVEDKETCDLGELVHKDVIEIVDLSEQQS
ncbi:MAG: hypothetical protein JW860_11955 [Sedimentisphaerales bacterium]|nr:hypothetical protein [Sedimentisphaerales bacterium]